MSVKIVEWPKNKAIIKRFLCRPAFDIEAEKIARRVLNDIAVNGDKAVLKYIRRFDGVSLKQSELKVARRELISARRKVKPDWKRAVNETHGRIEVFAKAGMKQNWLISSPKGGKLGEQFTPIDRVGIYVPGGSAPLVSTALMTVTLARTAGVSEIVVCTPSVGGKQLDPVLLYALERAGATEIYKVGGIQGIGLMAYGTRTIRKVRKIAGPGGTFVTAAKRLVYGNVALDLVAGPSEIAILADDAADASCVTVDLLSQAEHGTGWEKALLITSSMKMAKAVSMEIDIQTKDLTRQKAVKKVIAGGMLIIVVKSLAVGMDLCNEFAPEHLELMTRKPEKWLSKVRHAGAVFVGKWSPEAVGDFVAGPSHVLPTGGAATMFSGLTVDDFRKRTSVISFTEKDLLSVMPVIRAFGQIEGLDAHSRSAELRFKKKR